MSEIYGGFPPFQKHSDTSKAAAESVAARAPTVRARIFDHIKRAPGGCTRDELEVAFKLPMQTVSPRVRELDLMGLIHDSGARRKTRRGRNAVVWVAKVSAGCSA